MATFRPMKIAIAVMAVLALTACSASASTSPSLSPSPSIAPPTPPPLGPFPSGLVDGLRTDVDIIYTDVVKCGKNPCRVPGDVLAPAGAATLPTVVLLNGGGKLFTERRYQAPLAAELAQARRGRVPSSPIGASRPAATATRTAGATRGAPSAMPAPTRPRTGAIRTGSSWSATRRAG